jgi:hypothetical protein
MHFTIFFNTPIIKIDKHKFKWRNMMQRDPPNTQNNACYKEHATYIWRHTEARANNYPWEKKSIRQYIFRVCVCRHNYSVRNNHAKCSIAIFHISSFSKFLTISYHMYQFHKMILNINFVFLVILKNCL